MRGHESVERMRLGGKRPEMIEVRLESRGNYRPFAGVFIEPEDRIERLDLRFTVGCFVMLSGQDAARVREAFGALQDHGAQRVIGHVTAPLREGVDLIEIFDTEGVLTWHKC